RERARGRGAGGRRSWWGLGGGGPPCGAPRLDQPGRSADPVGPVPPDDSVAADIADQAVVPVVRDDPSAAEDDAAARLLSVLVREHQDRRAPGEAGQVDRARAERGGGEVTNGRGPDGPVWGRRRGRR